MGRAEGGGEGREGGSGRLRGGEGGEVEGEWQSQALWLSAKTGLWATFSHSAGPPDQTMPRTFCCSHTNTHTHTISLCEGLLCFTVCA